MRLCAYWDCMEEVDEGISFCKEHAKRLNHGLIDKCPKCGRYKDVRQKLCPDCNYGRPVAGWKISSRNLDEIEYQELEKPDEKAQEDAIPVYNAGISQPVSRGEATCPSCGSPDLTYKKAFDYFRCNNCETTFITPVYSYGEAPGSSGNTAKKTNTGTVTDPRKEPEPPAPPKPSPILGAPPPVRQDPVPPPPVYQPPVYNAPPPVRQEPPPSPPPVYREPQPPAYQPPPAYQQQPTQYYEQPAQRWEEPAIPYVPPAPSVHPGKDIGLNPAQMAKMDDKTLTSRLFKLHGGGGQGSKIGWAYLAVYICIVAIIALLCWVFFNAQIGDILDSL